MSGIELHYYLQLLRQLHEFLKVARSLNDLDAIPLEKTQLQISLSLHHLLAFTNTTHFSDLHVTPSTILPYSLWLFFLCVPSLSQTQRTSHSQPVIEQSEACDNRRQPFTLS